MGAWKSIKAFFTDILDIFCPRVCYGCGKPFKRDGEQLICWDCLMGIPKVNSFHEDHNIVTDYFLGKDVRIEYGCSYLNFTKGNIIQELIHNTKYFSHPELGIRLGQMAGEELIRNSRFIDIDAIIPVPMHPKKLKIRGYNQAEKISEGISQVYGKPIRNDILIKTQFTESQTKMNKIQRMENSQKIFSYANTDPSDTSHYLIVDDVYTTGSTVLNCAIQLRKSRPNCRISIFTLAKA